MIKLKFVVAIFAAIALSACGPDRPPVQQQYVQPQQAQQYAPAPPQYAPQPAPVIIQQQAAPAHGSGVNTGDVALGALAGAAAMHAMSNRPAAVQPTYAPRPSYSYQPSRVVTTTTVRKSGGSTITRTTSRRR